MRILLLLPIILCGCAMVHTVTQSPVAVSTNQVAMKTTRTTAIAFFDAQTVMNKLVVRGETVHSNEWAEGTYIGSINESSSSTNLNALVQSIVAGAVQGAVSAAK